MHSTGLIPLASDHIIFLLLLQDRDAQTVLPLQFQSATTHLCWLCTAGFPSSWRETRACFWPLCPRLSSRRSGWRTCSRVSLAQIGKRRAEWVRAAADGAAIRDTVREDKRGDRGQTGEERRDGAQMLGVWGSRCQSACPCVSVCVYARAVWMRAGISRLVGPAWGCGASLCIGTVPAPSVRLRCLSCSTDGGWGCDGEAHPQHAMRRHAFTCTPSTTTLSTIAQSCCCHSNHKSKCGQASEEKSCGYSKTEVVKVNSTHSVFANHLLSSQSLLFRAETEQWPSKELNIHYYDEYWDFSFLFTKNTNIYYT